MKMILAATRPNEEIYFITDPDGPNDGVSVSSGTIRRVPFWSYVYRYPVEQLQSNDFLKDLWTQSSSAKKWTDRYMNRAEALPTDLLEPIKPFLLEVPPETPSKPAEDFMDLGQPKKASDKGTKPETKARNIPGRSRVGRGFAGAKRGSKRTALALEPYDPDARDADGDGIVQEGTAWERPDGGRIIDALGREIRRGRQSGFRPTGIRVVDVDGNDVDYKPTYDGGRAGTIGGSTVPQVRPSVKPPAALSPAKKPSAKKPAKKKPAKKPPKPKKKTPLGEHGADSLKERGLPTVREKFRAASTPPKPELPKPELVKPDEDANLRPPPRFDFDASANTPPPPRFDFDADADRPPPRFDPDANANPSSAQADEQVPKLEDLNGKDREWVQQQLEAIYMSGEERERATSGIVKEESIEDLERRIRFLELSEIPTLRRDANNKDLSKRDRAFAGESLAIEEQRLAAYKAGVERKRELAPAKAPRVELTPEEMVKLEKDMAERYANLRKKRGGIVGRWMVKTYGDGDPPPWETDKNIKIEELREMVTRKSPEDMVRLREWVKQVYAIDEVVGRNGLRFRVQIEDSDIQIRDSQIDFVGKVRAFNVDTNEWEDVGGVVRIINVKGGYVTNAQLMLGKSAGYDNPLGNKAKNEGFTSVFNPHAFTWLKASGFERAEVTAISDGRFVWGRAGFRQERGSVMGDRIADLLMEEVKKYRDGEEDGLIRTDLDADLIEYLTTVAKQKDFTIDAPQNPEYILALAGDKNFTEAEKKAYDRQLQEWFTVNAPFGTGKLVFTDENVPDDPRKLV